ncbi:serpin family protein [bacterium]|nr:serpin family protein [bacterium]QQR60011.1 MAG: serpin family protein [Candidatus Melainabacteria bacterium]
MTTLSKTNPSLAFGLSLLKQEVAAATDKTKSVLLSPASVAIALAMTMNGARDTTLAGMKTTLGYDPAESIDVINASLKSLLTTLTAQDTGVELNVANAVWAEQTMPFKPDFIQTVADNFDAQVTTSDFADPATKDAINAWASDKTKGKIPTIIEDISPDMVMFLLNAIYFKGPWSSKFDKAKTYDRTFTNFAGAASSVPFMNDEKSVRYVEDPAYTAVSLPFGKDGKVSLYLLLPADGTDIDTFVAGLSSEQLLAVKTGYKEEVLLSIPRFEVDYDTDLVETLKSLGMEEACSAGANLSGMADASMYIHMVKHKTYAKFDEEGGEAAAVTAVGVGLESVSFTPMFTADRPFVAAIVAEDTDTVLFLGKIAEVK